MAATIKVFAPRAPCQAFKLVCAIASLCVRQLSQNCSLGDPKKSLFDMVVSDS